MTVHRGDLMRNRFSRARADHTRSAVTRLSQSNKRSRAWLAALCAAIIIAATTLLTGLTTPAKADTAGGVYTPYQARIADSRAGTGGLPAAGLSAGSVYLVPVAGVGSIPATGVQSASVTITTLGSTSGGTVKMGASAGASTSPGDLGNYSVYDSTGAASSTAIVPLGADGNIAVSITSGTTKMIVDVQGYFAPDGASTGGKFVTIPSTRAADSRTNLGINGATSNGATATVDVSSAVPTGAKSIFVSIIVTGQTGPGWITAYRAGDTRPNSSLNFYDTHSQAFGEFVPVSAAGKIAIYVNSGGPLDLVLDVEGYSTAGSGATFTTLSTPTNVYDSSATAAPFQPGETRVFTLTGDNGIPAYSDDTTAVAARITATSADGSTSGGGYIQAWPADAEDEPTTSVLNYDFSRASNNTLAILPSSSDDLLTIQNNGTHPVNISIDAEGYFTNPAATDNSADLSQEISEDVATGAESGFTSNAGLSDADTVGTDGTGDLSSSVGQDSPSTDPTDVVADGVDPLRSGIVGSDGRSRVNNTTAPEPRRIVYIRFYVRNKPGYVFGCSGTMINKNTVLTAGHCVYSFNHWNYNWTVYPGKNASSNPYGSCHAKNAYAVKGWFDSSNQNRDVTNGYDYGAIKLSCSIGNTTGVMGYSTNGVVGKSVRITGYPGEKKPTNSMWTEAGKIAKKTPHVLYTYIDITSGQSGSPMYASGCGSWCIYGVATGSSSGGQPNFAVRIISSVAKNLAHWRSL